MRRHGRPVPARLLCCAETINHRFFLAFFLRPDFFLLAARMLSTRLGRLRPAFLAERLAAAFRAGESFFDFFPAFLRGFAFFQGGFLAMSIPSRIFATTWQKPCKWAMRIGVEKRIARYASRTCAGECPIARLTGRSDQPSLLRRYRSAVTSSVSRFSVRVRLRFRIIP